MPATSTHEFIELHLKSDTSGFEKDLSGAEKRAQEIAGKIGDAFVNMTGTAKAQIAKIEETVTKMRDASYDNLRSSVEAFKDWFKETSDTFRKNHPKIAGMISLEFLKPMINALSKWKSSATTIILETQEKIFTWSKNLYDTTTTKVKKIMDDFGKSMADSVEKIKDNVQKRFPALAKTIEGAWLGGKVAANALKTSVLAIISVMPKATQAVVNFANKVANGFKKAHDTILGAGLVIKYYVTRSYEAVKSTAVLASKVSGLYYIFKGIQKAATFSLKVTGIAAAFGVLGTFWRNISSGGFGAFDRLFDYIDAAIEPFRIALNQLINVLAPKVIELLSPFLDLVAATVSEISRNIENVNNEGSALSRIFKTLLAIGNEVTSVLGEIIGVLLDKVIPTLLPIVEGLSKTLLGLAKNLLPAIAEIITSVVIVVANLVEKISPVVIFLVETIGQLIGDIAKEVAKLVNETGTSITDLVKALAPAIVQLVGVVAGLVKALAPVIVSLAKIFTLVVLKLFAPNVIKIITLALKVLSAFGKIIGEIVYLIVIRFGGTASSVMIKTVETISSAFGTLFDYVTAGFEKTINFMLSMWKKFKDIFGLEEVPQYVGTVFGAIGDTISKAMGTMRSFINMQIIDRLNDILKADLPVIGKLNKLIGIKEIEHLAKGGIVTGPTPALVGETPGVPEMVLPLQPEVIQKVIPTMVNMHPEVKFPDQIEVRHTNEILRELRAISKKLDSLKTNDVLSMLGTQIQLTSGGFA